MTVPAALPTCRRAGLTDRLGPLLAALALLVAAALVLAAPAPARAADPGARVCAVAAVPAALAAMAGPAAHAAGPALTLRAGACLEAADIEEAGALGLPAPQRVPARVPRTAAVAYPEAGAAPPPPAIPAFPHRPPRAA